jgi:hypothetical protein
MGHYNKLHNITHNTINVSVSKIYSDEKFLPSRKSRFYPGGIQEPMEEWKFFIRATCTGLAQHVRTHHMIEQTSNDARNDETNYR